MGPLPGSDTAANPSNFMGAVAPGAGSALMTLLRRSQMGQGGSVLNQNTQSPQMVPPSTPPQMPQGGMQPQIPSNQPQPQPTQAPQPQMSPQDSNTSLVLKALSGYLDHAKTMNEVSAGIPQ